MSASLQKQSPCKVNLLLNILGRRTDGFHELETIMQPLPLFDEMTFARGARGIDLTCSHAELPTDKRNLAHAAAAAFLEAAAIAEGVRIRLEKRIPLAAGLGGGSGNAATTLLGLNELFGGPLAMDRLAELAAGLGSDIPFFLQDQPALATGRGEKIVSLKAFPSLRGVSLLLVHPGFGVSTAWAYQHLARFPSALNGRPGRAQDLADALQTADLAKAAAGFYNSLEAPVLEKYPLLLLIQEFLRGEGAVAAMMSGSGSTTFGIFKLNTAAEAAAAKVKAKFGNTCWTAVVTL